MMNVAELQAAFFGVKAVVSSHKEKTKSKMAEKTSKQQQQHLFNHFFTKYICIFT